MKNPRPDTGTQANAKTTGDPMKSSAAESFDWDEVIERFKIMIAELYPENVSDIAGQEQEGNDRND